MADTYTTNLRVRLPETGAYGNSWGTVLNQDAIQLLDTAIAGQATIALGVLTSYSLPALGDGASSTSRNFCLIFTGTPAGTVTVTVPATVTSKFYLIDNDTGQDILLKYSASTGITIADGSKQLVWCDGSEVYNVATDALNALELGGIAAALYARLDTAQNFSAAQAITLSALSDGATIALDASLSNYFRVTLGGNRTLANPTNARDGQTIEVLVIQDGSGSRTLAYGSKIRWPDGTAPTLTTTAGRADLIVMTYYLTQDVWLATVVQNYTVT
jgi:hypothetical protein